MENGVYTVYADGAGMIGVFKVRSGFIVAHVFGDKFLLMIRQERAKKSAGTFEQSRDEKSQLLCRKVMRPLVRS